MKWLCSTTPGVPKSLRGCRRPRPARRSPVRGRRRPPRLRPSTAPGECAGLRGRWRRAARRRIRNDARARAPHIAPAARRCSRVPAAKVCSIGFQTCTLSITVPIERSIVPNTEFVEPTPHLRFLPHLAWALSSASGLQSRPSTSSSNARQRRGFSRFMPSSPARLSQSTRPFFVGLSWFNPGPMDRGQAIAKIALTFRPTSDRRLQPVNRVPHSP
jgi:hypothetical protein